MDKRYIRENQVIERYLKGALTPDEERAFEEAYVGDPDLLDELELVERLGQGVKELGAAGGLTRNTPHRSWLTAPVGRQWAAAASLLLVVSLAVSAALYRENLSLRQQGQGLVANMSTRLLPVLTVRGAPEIVLEAPGANDWAVLLIDTGFTAYDSYRGVVSRRLDERRSEVWSADGLRPEYQDQLALGMPGSLLEPGEYEIEITGRMNDWPPERSEPVSRTALRVAAPGGPR